LLEKRVSVRIFLEIFSLTKMKYEVIEIRFLICHREVAVLFVRIFRSSKYMVIEVRGSKLVETWRKNLYILMICQFFVLSAMSMIMPFLPLYLKEMGIKNAEEAQLWSGIIFGANFFSAFIFAPIWGGLADKYGRKIMILRSGFGMAITIFLTGLTQTPLQLLCLRLLNGMISGFIPASISLMSTCAPKNRVGWALGMLQSGAVAGTIIGPFFGGLLAEIIGFRMIFFLTSITILVTTIIVLFAVKEEFCPNPEQKKSNFWRDGSVILQQRPLIVLFVVGFLMNFSLIGANPQLSLYVSSLHPPGGYVAFFAGLVAAITGVSNMISSPILGKMGDRYGSNRVLFFAMIGAAVFFIPHTFVTTVWQLVIVRFSLGLFIGGLSASLSTLIRQYAPKGKESTAFGYSTSALCFGNMMGPITCGFLSSVVGIRGVFILIAFCLLAGAFCLKLGLREEYVQDNQLSSYSKIR
jgi:MFS transporter, DHA1 family, multidrug resistance protein